MTMRLRLSLALFIALVPACSPARAVIFVHISDPHVNVSASGRFREEGVRDLQRVVDAIRVIQPAFVIVTGDVTELGDEASPARYRSEIDRASDPVAVSLDCTSLNRAVYELRVSMADEAGNRATSSWRLLIKGGK